MKQLKEIFDLQKEFQLRLGHDTDTMSHEDRTAHIKGNAFFVIDEVMEMCKELAFLKPWKDYSDLTDEQIAEMYEAARKEWIDVFIFLLNIGLALDIDAQDVYDLFMEKNKINHNRQDNGYKEVR